MTCNHKVVSSNLTVGFGCDVRVVKEIDLKSIGFYLRRFESCQCRFGAAGGERGRGALLLRRLARQQAFAAARSWNDKRAHS